MRMGFGFGLCKGNGGPSPAFDSNFLSGTLPPGLTYTNSSTVRTYFGADGLLKTAAINEPIFEYDPVTRALLGMRWEMEQRTNLLLQTTLPGGGAVPTGWTQPAGTGTSAPAASIYGNADGAVAYLQSATAQRPYLSQTTSSLSANTTYTVSLLIESVTGTVTPDNVIGFAASPAGASVSYPACSANPSGGTSSGITSGVLEVRLSIGATAGTVSCRVGLGTAANATGTLKFSRPQLEVGTSRSSFIPTTSTAVIRQPDVLTATSISPWYNQSEGTVVFEGIVSDLSAVISGYFVFSDATTNNRILVVKSSSNQHSSFIASGGATVLSQSVGTVTAGTVFRSVLAYAVNNGNFAANGTLATPDTSMSVPSVTTLRFGCTINTGVEPFMGYARRFQYFNTSLKNQIQGMSRV